jgi:hypothetical protein
MKDFDKLPNKKKLVFSLEEDISVNQRMTLELFNAHWLRHKKDTSRVLFKYADTHIEVHLSSLDESLVVSNIQFFLNHEGIKHHYLGVVDYAI